MKKRFQARTRNFALRFWKMRNLCVFAAALETRHTHIYSYNYNSMCALFGNGVYELCSRFCTILLHTKLHIENVYIARLKHSCCRLFLFLPSSVPTDLLHQVQHASCMKLFFFIIFSSSTNITIIYILYTYCKNYVFLFCSFSFFFLFFVFFLVFVLFIQIIRTFTNTIVMIVQQEIKKQPRIQLMLDNL